MIKIKIEYPNIPVISDEYWDDVICEVCKRYLSESGLKFHDTMKYVWLKR